MRLIQITSLTHVAFVYQTSTDQKMKRIAQALHCDMGACNIIAVTLVSLLAAHVTADILIKVGPAKCNLR